MTVLAYDPNRNAAAADLLGFKYTSLKDLMNHADIVTLHAPLTNENRHMIGDHNTGDFKRGAVLINTARGGLVDTCALLKALDDGILSGAGLDVLEGEEVISEEKRSYCAAAMRRTKAWSWPCLAANYFVDPT